MRVLLDTFPFIWLTSEPSKLSRLASEVLSDQGNEFYLSDASVLELSLKYNFSMKIMLSPDFTVHARASRITFYLESLHEPPSRTGGFLK